MMDGVQQMVSSYQRQNLEAAVTGTTSQKAEKVTEKVIGQLLESVAVDQMAVQAKTAQGLGKGSLLNLGA